mmetsp:Transcript_61113/g.142981  ORF Transcript_61113/g.142981 Transcript_61113/m.142981 type:complete len:234 (+) Transcript_61113:827-1528(+)
MFLGTRPALRWPRVAPAIRSGRRHAMSTAMRSAITFHGLARRTAESTAHAGTTQAIRLVARTRAAYVRQMRSAAPIRTPAIRTATRRSGTLMDVRCPAKCRRCTARAKRPLMPLEWRSSRTSTAWTARAMAGAAPKSATKPLPKCAANRAHASGARPRTKLVLCPAAWRSRFAGWMISMPMACGWTTRRCACPCLRSALVARTPCSAQIRTMATPSARRQSMAAPSPATRSRK